MGGMVLRGRPDEMAKALGLIRRVDRTGQGGGLIICGEAGIGKSALLAAITREATRAGTACGSGRADRIGRVIPGGPLLTALRDGPDPILTRAQLATPEPLTGQPLLLLDAVANALEQASTGRTVAVAVDDVPWLDDLSAFLLRSLPGASRLDQAWAVYDEVGAHGARAEAQRVLRAAGVRRSWWPATTTRPGKGWAALTDAGVRVARLVGAGYTNKSAAARLSVSANTVGTHLRSVFAKLDVSSRVQPTNVLNARESA